MHHDTDANPIVSATQALLAQLDDDTRAKVAETVRSHSTHALGEELSVEDELLLIFAAKTIASSDGLSSVELAGLRRIMDRFHLPAAAQQHVLDFDVAAVRPEHIAALVAPRSRMALLILHGVVTLAALDGLSIEEQASARRVGELFGFEAPLIDVILAEAQLTSAMLVRGDEAVIELVRPLRHAIFRLI